MRILWITPWFPQTPDDSAFTFILHPASALGRTNHPFRVVVLEPALRAIQRASRKKGLIRQFTPPSFDVDIRKVLFPRIPRLRFLRLSCAMYRAAVRRPLIREIEAFEPDVIHVHTEWGAYGVVPVARELRIPIVVTVHAGDRTPQVVRLAQARQLFARTMNSCDRVLIVGRNLLEYFDDLGATTANVTVMPNGFQLPAARDARGRDWTGPLRVVSVSVLREGKGVDTAITAFARLFGSINNDATFDIVGDGPDRDKLQNLAHRLGVGNKIRFLGRLDHSAAMRQLSDKHVFLLPSYIEAFGVAHLEAMGAGVIPVGVEGQGPSEFIDHANTGFLVPPHDIGSIVAVLRSIDMDRVTAKRISAAAMEKALNAYTWDDHVRRLIELYSLLPHGEEARS